MAIIDALSDPDKLAIQEYKITNNNDNTDLDYDNE